MKKWLFYKEKWDIMNYFVLFLITFAIALFGSIVFDKMKIPCGQMIGALICVTAFNIFTENAVFPVIFKNMSQILSGTMIGRKVTKQDVIELRKVIIPTCILLVFMTLMNITVGVSVNKLGGLDIATALFAAAPGGLSDMALLADDLGANAAYVTILQLVRVLTIYMVMPAIIKNIVGKNSKSDGEVRKQNTAASSASEKLPLKTQLFRFSVTMAIGVAGGILFHYIGVPSGYMIGAMVLTAIYNVFTGNGFYYKKLNFLSQNFSGAYLAIGITMEDILGLGQLIIPTVIVLLGVVVFAVLSGFVINKATKLDIGVSVMASTPGGISEISLLSEELGSDTTKVSVMQSCRLMFVLVVFPTLIRVLSSVL